MARPRSTVTVRDRGYSRLLRAVRGMRDGGISIGIHPREARVAYPGGATVGEVARVHASGGRYLPRRDPIGQWWEREGQREVLRRTRAALTRALRSGRPPWRELERAGAEMVRRARAEFQRLRPLAPATVRRKGSRRILVRTGLLLRSVQYRVRRAGRARPPG